MDSALGCILPRYASVGSERTPVIPCDQISLFRHLTESGCILVYAMGYFFVLLNNFAVVLNFPRFSPLWRRILSPIPMHPALVM